MKIVMKFANINYQEEWYCPYCKSPLYYLYDENDRLIGIGLDQHFQCSRDECGKNFKKGIKGFCETDLDLTKVEGIKK